MRRKKISAVVTSIILAASLAMAGCGASTTSASTETSVSVSVSEETETEANSITFSDSTYSETEFSGMVQSVEGNEITVSIMDNSMGMGGGMGQPGDMPNGGNGEGGEAPSMPDGGNGGNGGSSEAPSMPDGSNGGNGGSGEAPSMPDGSNGGNGEGGEAPSMPDGNNGDNGGSGEAPSMPDNSNGGSAPEKPDGEAPSVSSGDAGNGGANQGSSEFSMGSSVTATIVLNDESVLKDSEGNTASLSDIETGSFVTVTLTDGEISSIVLSSGMQGGGMGQPGGMSSGVDSYTAVNEYTEDTTVTGETFESTGSDENAVLVSSGNVTLSDVTVTRTSSDSTGGDNSSFYGVGAAVLATSGTLTVENADITTDSAGGAGVFAYGDSTVYVSDSTITTKQNTSGGIHAAGGGTLYATNLDVTTNGESSAAIRSDRGGGTMVVDGGSYVSNGTGSPAVYCTADITVSNATLTATGSEAVCIEGLNSLKLTDCDLTGTMPESSQNDCTWNVIVYQSMSGDSEVGNGVFSMTGGTLTANNGGIFYTTNTESTFYLSDVDITYSDDNPFFLMCTGNTNQRGWGTAGANGADCSFTADSQSMEGDVIFDSISNLDFYMTNGSSLTGAFVDDESYAGNGGDGEANLYIDASSTWTVTGNSTLTNLYNAGTIVDASGNTVSIVGTDGTVIVSGTSAYTITVSNYSTTVDLSGAYTA